MRAKKWLYSVALCVMALSGAAVPSAAQQSAREEILFARTDIDSLRQTLVTVGITDLTRPGR